MLLVSKVTLGFHLLLCPASLLQVEALELVMLSYSLCCVSDAGYTENLRVAPGRWKLNRNTENL